MKINEMIKELQAVSDKYGDIDVVMASDSEGNGYSTIDKNFRYSRVYEDETAFINAASRGTVTGKPMDLINDFYDKAKVIGICLFPWAEHFQAADEAVEYDKKHGS